MSQNKIGIKIEAIAIGSSTGGPQALEKVLPLLKPNLNVPIFLVQHMPGRFTKGLADSLNTKCELKVVEASQMEDVERNTVYIAPGKAQMKLDGTKCPYKILITDDPPEEHCKPAVDYTMRSVAKIYGRRTLAIILTGMGADGMKGCQHIKDAGGLVIAQNEETCAVYGMPRAVVEANLADHILPLESIAPMVNSFFRN